MTETAIQPRPARGRGPSRLSGVIALDKPAGMTSFEAVREVRRALGERRTGHAGTLDPSATGLLPVCVGRATRLVDHFHRQPKRYHCGVRFGEVSDTLDVEGEVRRSGDASALTEEAVRGALGGFVGEIEQIPPMHSAVRHEGRHLYDLARRGVEVERSPRRATVERAELLAFRPGERAEAELDVVCGKGTYMRVLAADLGTALGTGGLLAWLERTAYGELTLADAITPERLAALADPASALLPADVAVAYLPRLDLIGPIALQVRRGQQVWVPKLPEPRPQGECRVHELGGGLIAIGELGGQLFRPTKVLADGPGQ